MSFVIRHSSFVLLLLLLLPLALRADPAATAPAATLPDPSSPAALGWLILVFAGALVVINQALAIHRHFRADPPAHATYATKADLAKLETDLDARLAGLSKASAESREKIYTGLTDIRDAIARLETQGSDQTRQLARLDVKLDHVAERAVTAQATAQAAKDAAAQAQNTADAARHHTP